jgi:hypothetical protein
VNQGNDEGGWLVALRKTLEAMPSDYRQRYEQIAQMRHDIQREIARAIEAPLNEYLPTLPQQTFEEKQQLATMVNNDLRLLNLRIRCSTPTGNYLAILVVDYRDHAGKDSRFRLQIVGPKGTRLRKNSSPTIPPLELMEAPPREEVFSSRFRGRRDDESPSR